jgi:hypothetical protein
MNTTAVEVLVAERIADSVPLVHLGAQGEERRRRRA